MINFKPAAGPYAHTENSSTRIMYQVVLALLPATIFGGVRFGPSAFVVVLTCVLACVGCELACLLLQKRKLSHCLDGSAILTGLILAMSLPPQFPVSLSIIGAAFAIVVGKQAYGGLGQNLFNPAMLARVFLLICFPVEMTQWIAPIVDVESVHQWMQFDGVSAATVLSKTLDSAPTVDLLTGHQAGSMGETNAILLLFGGCYLLYRGIITWTIPVTFMLGILIPASIAYLIDPQSFLAPYTHVFSGGAMLCAFFIATDLVTSPTSNKGQAIYGLGCGCLVWLIRSVGSYPEGVAFAILIMNAVSPLIDYYIQPVLFGRKQAQALGKEK
ncbi:RnfABCDGE type electron transport complex subunit D [Vibrio sp. AK197]